MLNYQEEEIPTKIIEEIVTEEIDEFILKMKQKKFGKNNFIMELIDENFKFYSSLARSFDSSLGNTFQSIARKIAKYIYGNNNVIIPSAGADLVIFDNNNCYIIEIKLGGNLDSKKLPSEFNALEQFYNDNYENLKEFNIFYCLGTVYIEPDVAMKLHTYFNNHYSNSQYLLLLQEDFWNFICGGHENGFSIVKEAYDNNISKINDFLEQY